MSSPGQGSPLRLGLMAKPPSKPVLAKGQREGQLPTRRGDWSHQHGKGRQQQEVKQRKGGSSPIASVPCTGDRSSPFALRTSWGFPFQQPLWQQARLEQLSLEVGCPQCVPHAGRAAPQPAQPLAGLCQEPNTVTV